jgi:hypothetical protein
MIIFGIPSKKSPIDTGNKYSYSRKALCFRPVIGVIVIFDY